jgi:hypothetical protein
MIDPRSLHDPAYRTYAMMMIFARAMARHAGETPDPVEVAADGMNEVFQWYCAHGPRRMGFDMRDDALEAAADTAEHLGFDEGVIMAASEKYLSDWAHNSCAILGTPSWSGYGTRIDPRKAVRVGSRVASRHALVAPPQQKALPPKK